MGYYRFSYTPGLFKHMTRPIVFTLVVDDFSVKYVGKKHAKHLANTFKMHYPLSEDWKGTLYCGIELNWN